MNIVGNNAAETLAIGVPTLVHSAGSIGVYGFLADLTALAPGDELQMDVYAAFAEAATPVLTYSVTYSQVQSEPGKISVPVLAPYGADFYLTYVAGGNSSVDVPWVVTRL